MSQTYTIDAGEGWEFVPRIAGRCEVKPGDEVWRMQTESWEPVTVTGWLTEWLYRRRVPKPNQFRPFANAAEFEPHRDRWVRRKEFISMRVRIDRYANGGPQHWTWQEAFDVFVFDDDGSPFGVEVKSETNHAEPNRCKDESRKGLSPE